MPDLDRHPLQRMDARKALIDVDERQGGGRGAHFTTRISLRSMESATAAMIIKPCTPICTLGGTPISTMPFDSTTTMSTPTSVCSTPPCPPESEVPPTTTAVTVVNSRPLPSCALPRHSSAADRIPTNDKNI